MRPDFPRILAFLLATATVAAVVGVPAAATPVEDLSAARRLQGLERWAASESLATKALARLEAEPRPDSIMIAEAHYLLGVARWRTVGYADGSALAAATRSLGLRENGPDRDDLAAAESHVLVARLLAGSDRADSALVHARRALAIREQRMPPTDTLLARSYDQIALIQRDRRDMKASLDAWTRAIEIRQAAEGPESPEIARLLAQTGVPWMELGELERARGVLEESLRMFARTSGADDVRRWIPLNILSDVEGRTGNVALRIDLLQEALRVLTRAYGENAREALTIRQNLAIALQHVGDAAGAQAVMIPLLPAIERQYGPTHLRTLNARQTLAIVSQLQGDLPTAMVQFRILDSLLALRPGPPLTSHALVQAERAKILQLQGRNLEAIQMFERALATDRGTRSPTLRNQADIYGEFARSYAALGDRAGLARVRDELAGVIAALPMGSDPRPGAHEYDQARIARDLGEDGAAWTTALDAEARARTSARLNLQLLPDRRALSLVRSEERFIDLIVDLARSDPPGRLSTAWDRVVRGRGMVRAELARRRLPPGLGVDTVLAGAHERWIAAQDALARRLVRSSGVGGDSLAQVRLLMLRTAADDAEAAYVRALGQRGVHGTATEQGLADVRARLAPDQALVGCLELRGDWNARALAPDSAQLVAFVARGADPAVVDFVVLGTRAELRGALDPWRAALATSPGPRAKRDDRAERESRRLGMAARARTWDRLAPLLKGASDVFLVADGELVDLPWQALPEGSDRYLVETGVRIHPLFAERELLEPVPSPTGATLLALGAPDFDRAGTLPASGNAPMLAMAANPELVRSVPDPCARLGRPVFGPLPGAQAEVADVARTWSGDPAGGAATVLTGREASELAFKDLAAGHGVIHIATHGYAAGDTCLAGAAGARGVGGLQAVAATTPPPAAAKQSAGSSGGASASPWLARRVWLALAGANAAAEHTADANEGLLTAEEVLTLDLAGTDWVVLSACHSGATEAWSREGAFGMRRAFDLAGVRSVIASEWSVEDDATREWMGALYRARSAGARTAAAAMESASSEILAARRKAGRSTHPFYWAGFTASGN